MKMQYVYNLQMKESDSIATHLNSYKGFISQFIAQGMKIGDELHPLLLMSTLSLSWETFITTVCNWRRQISHTLWLLVPFEDARQKSFEHISTGDTFMVQDITDRLNCSRSSFEYLTTYGTSTSSRTIKLSINNRSLCKSKLNVVVASMTTQRISRSVMEPDQQRHSCQRWMNPRIESQTQR